MKVIFSKFNRDQRLLFRPSRQRALIESVKRNTGLNWKTLARLFGVCQTTFRIEWGRERTSIPCRAFEKCISLYPSCLAFQDDITSVLDSNWGQKKGILKTLRTQGIQRASVPDEVTHDESFAEFIGIVLGDGHISTKTITISLEYPLEQAYAEYVYNFILKLFKKKPIYQFKQKEKRNCVYLLLNSTEVVGLLGRVGLASGNKIRHGTRIPKEFFLRTRHFCANASAA